MTQLLELIETTSPWAILAAGIVLIIVDVLVTNDSWLAWIGSAVLGVGVFNAFDAPGVVQLIAFPILVVIALVLVRPIMVRTSQPRDQSTRVEDLLGCSGTVLDIKEDSPSEGRAAMVGHGEWRIRHENGVPLCANERIWVTGIDGLTLLVSREADEESPSTG